MSNIRTIVLSVNDHPSYFPYWLYITKAWNKLGWNTLTFYLGKKGLRGDINNIVVPIDKVEGYRDVTVIQVSRLLGHHYISDGIIMTSDVDMMPLCNYWQPKYEDITVYGKNLAIYNQIPMCYVAMNNYYWRQIIPENSIKKLLSQYKCAKSKRFSQYWFTDQIILTDRINRYVKRHSFDITYIPRPKYGKYAYDRLDRAQWVQSKNFLNIKVDAHLPKQFDLDTVQELILNIRV